MCVLLQGGGTISPRRMFRRYSLHMAEVPAVNPCSNPGCDQPGTKSCSACKTTFYCCVICQTADWAHHKEECPGHLRKVGKANLEKAFGFHQQQNWVQALRYGELAATKLKQLKDRRLETVEDISTALICKYDALQYLGRHREALECIKECYTLWAMNHMRNPGSMKAALMLIQSCIHNKEFEDAEHYARHAYFMIAEMTDNFIPVDQQPRFLADVSYWLATAIYHLAESGGTPPEEKQKAGKEAIELARKALGIHSQLFGTESREVAADMTTIAIALDHYNNINDDEIPRLLKQANTIFGRLEGSSSPNVATANNNLGNAYQNRAKRTQAANDLDECLANLELALLHYRETTRIWRTINHMDMADQALRIVALVEESIRKIGIARAEATAAATAANRG